MTERLTRIYTRSGDQGKTGLGNGQRVDKTAGRIEVLGTVDELNAALGIVLALLPKQHPEIGLLTALQHQLFDLGGELAMADPNYVTTTPQQVAALEQKIDTMNATLPPLREFILPGGSPAAAHCHMARCICRRAERRMLALLADNTQSCNPEAAVYLNRLSDLLFVLCRVLARQDGGTEVFWQPGNPHLT
ncbi:cob(I)yrinic acid a,c-diamide adenosyltransferase [Pontibacter sp. JAM-7]|uniref:cob(I)yrinic acid a,c-diamide adenosyltransferase n=1 Tax=Pontibacter sp. JAM-7 TaxID=3366581 RepID=UPI003AF68986